MATQSTTAYLVYNLRENQVDRTRQTEPGKKELQPYERVIRLEIEADIPEVDTHEMSVELDLDEDDIKNAIAQDLAQDQDGPDSIQEYNPLEFVYSVTSSNYEEVLEVIREDIDLDDPEELDQVIDWFRVVIAEEHTNFERPAILNRFEEELEEYKTLRSEALRQEENRKTHKPLDEDDE